MKRGLNQQEAMAYVGAKRRAWEVQWAPRLVGIPQGVCLVFDRQDLDRLFEDFKRSAAAAVGHPNNAERIHANTTYACSESNGEQNKTKKEKQKWVRKCEESTLTKKPAIGKLTNGGMERGFASVASSILKRPKAG